MIDDTFGDQFKHVVLFQIRLRERHHQSVDGDGDGETVSI